jgi:transposase
MIEMEAWFMIRELFAQGLNITAISDKTGYDRKTVKKYLDLTTIPEPKQRAKKESKLDEFKEYIIKKLHEGPFTAVRLFREIQERGFTGKCTIVRDFVRKVRPDYGVQAVLRYETKPRVQAQVDWSEFGKVEIDDKNKTVLLQHDTWLLKDEVYRIYIEY